MYYRHKKGNWYGMLETSKSSTILIWDPTLPKAEAGKIYFYNTDKDAFIEYVEEIARNKLRDLTEDELKEANSKFQQKWVEAKSVFMKQRGVVSARAPAASKESNINKMLSDVDESADIVDDEFEDL